jgi:hypothetical protein
VLEQCQAVQGSMPVAGAQTCRSVQAGQWMESAACRMAVREASDDRSATDQCAPIDGRPVSEARVDAYQQSWLHQALSLQRSLAADAPLTEELIPHTHNSFNASSYKLGSASYPTLTNQDPNQAYSLTDQLRMDMRAVEVDLHWVPSPYGTAATGGYEVTNCHGTSEALPGGQHFHVGCTDDRPFSTSLAEFKAWLDANPGQFVLLYLENQLDNSAAAHERAGQLLASSLGGLIYKPPTDAPCAPMPVGTSAQEVLATGAQVLIVGNCDGANGRDTAWGGLVYARGPAWDESGDPTDYGASQCAADRAKRDGASPVFRRYFEETTWLVTMGDTAPAATSALGHNEPITAPAVAQMVRCGVNIVGLDQLTPEDPRLEALVWSWAGGEPSASASGSASGACAYEGGDGRFRASACDGPERHFACVDAGGGWHVTAAVGPWAWAWGMCDVEFPGSSFAVPRNGWRNQQVVAANTAGGEVWLNYGAPAGAWQPDVLARPVPAPSPGYELPPVPAPSAPAAVSTGDTAPPAPSLIVVLAAACLRQSWLSAVGD